MRVNGRLKLAFILAILACLTLLAADFFIFPNIVTSDVPTANRGTNGLWLRYHWYFGKHSPEDAAALVKLLKDEQIRYAYLHVLSVEKDGQFHNQHPEAVKGLLAQLRAGAPDTKLIAWVSAGDWYPAHGTDIANTDTRKNMVAAANWLVTTAGFDGVQWDYEPCPDGSQDFLRLLEETKTGIAPNKFLSVATPMVYTNRKGNHAWTQEYFTQVCQRCDQVAVMGYDSPLLYPRMYGWLMRQQPPLITQAAAKSGSHCKVIIGIPTYDRKDNPMRSFVETLRLAIISVRQGVNDPRTDQSHFEGVAVFAEYTTDASEWKTYNKLWLLSE